MKDIEANFSTELRSVILQGSLATGSFYVPKSDIDIIVIVTDLTENQREAFYDLLKKYHETRPYTGGLEASVLRARDAQDPRHPMPFLLHFSETTDGLQPIINDRLPEDEDLVANLMVARERGIALSGLSPRKVIGAIPWDNYLSSVRADIKWILEGEHLLTTPFYSVLNLCRWLMMQSPNAHMIPSKEEAGEWALKNLPATESSIVAKALDVYRSNREVHSREERKVGGVAWDQYELLHFRDYMRQRLEV